MRLIHLHRLSHDVASWLAPLLAAFEKDTTIVLREQAIKHWLRAPTVVSKNVTIYALADDAHRFGITEDVLTDKDITPISDTQFARLVMRADQVWSLP